MKNLITYTLLFLLPLAACKKEYKYPEDPKKSRKSPNERLKGTWQISEYRLNGLSIKDTLSKVAGTDINQIVIHYYIAYDQWKFDAILYTDLHAFDDYHYLIFRPVYGKDQFNKVFITPFKYSPGPTETKWTVTKLYENDLHLQLVTDTGEYRITFIKQ